MREQTIQEYFDYRKVRGDFGLEIEMEGDREFPYDGIPNEWRATGDGSLRGESVEYVSRRPLKIASLNQHVDSLKKAVEDHGVNISKSFRAGVHVHINAHDLTLKEMYKNCFVYYVLETMLLKFCGETREGNFNCLRLRDADYPLELLTLAIRTGDLSYLNSQDIRYASLNLGALFKFGSLEYRGLETNPDFSKIKSWVKILHKIKEYAKNLDNSMNLLYEISYKGPDIWVKEIFGEELFKEIWYDQAEDDIMEDLRNCQLLAYNIERI